jgi:cyclase
VGRCAAALGAGEILLTSIDRDGTRQGFDCRLTAEVSGGVPIPVIASGGAGTYEHFAEVFTRDGPMLRSLPRCFTSSTTASRA